MVTPGADQAVRQQGTSQMRISEGANVVAISNGHVLIIDLFPQLKNASCDECHTNGTQLIHHTGVVRVPTASSL